MPASPLRIRRILTVAGLAGLVLAAAAGGRLSVLPQQGGTVDLLAQANIQIDGAVAGDGAGFSVATAGDVNGDGRSDIVIGAPTASNNGRGVSGSAYVVFGKPTLTTLDLASLGDNGFRIDGGAANDVLGIAVAGAGDVNGDGKADVVVGAYHADNNARTDSGSVYVVFGKSTTASLDVATLGDAGFRIDGQVAGDMVGGAVGGGGDVNGDGRPDLIVGAADASNNGATSGSAYVVFGKASTTTVDLSALGSGGYRIDGAAAGDKAGRSAANAGDVNGDGRADVVVGAHHAGNNGRANSGSAYVVFGKQSTTTVSLAALGEAGFRLDGAAAGDLLGWSSATAGDINGDGKAEVVALASAAGSAYVVFGKSSSSAIDVGALGTGGFRIGGAAGNSVKSVAGVGDVNGDGRPDVSIGAYLADNNGRTDSGSAHVVFGKTSTTTVDLAGLGSAGFRVDGAAANDLAGTGIGGSGDVNGDARPDLLVGSYGASNNGRAGSGSVNVVFGFGEAALAYDPVIGSVGKALVAQGPKTFARTGTPAFTVSPALPAGLTLDPATGFVSGTPTAAIAAAPFTMTMKDLTGSVNAPLQITVVQPDTKAPLATLGAKPAQRVAKTGKLFVATSCDEACILTVDVVFRVKGITTTVASIPAKRTLKTAKKTNFKIVLTPDARSQLKAILLPGRTGSAAIAMTAVDASGNKTTKNLKVSVAP